MDESNQAGRLLTAAILRHAGAAALSGSLALAAGYWLAEAGLRWIPTMLSIITTACLAALAAMTAAELLGGKALRTTNKGLKMRKRVKTLLTLVVVAGAARLIAFALASPCALTAMSPEDYQAVFAADRQRLVACDAGLAGCRRTLDGLDLLASPEGRLRTPRPDEEQALRELFAEIYDFATCLDAVHGFHADWHRFDPSRAQRDRHLRSFLLYFGADLVLYEHLRAICEGIERNPNAVKFLNAPDPARGLEAEAFSRLRDELADSAQTARIAAGTGYFLWLDRALAGSRLSEQMGEAALWKRVEEGCRTARNNAGVRQVAVGVGGDVEPIKRAARRSWLPLQERVARWMGNTRVQRPGEYLIADEQLDAIAARLAPGDILLSRKNWYLSNVGLPGFWPHAVLYVGDEAALHAAFDGDAETRRYIAGLCGQEMDLCDFLDQRFGLAWQQYVQGREGSPCRVIEAVAPGVMAHTLAEARGDYLAAMRPTLPTWVRAAAIIEAFGHLGKPYDYEFDFATDHALVCTELVWRCYRPSETKPGLDIAPIDYAGRKTLPANEIARAFERLSTGEHPQLEFVLFYDASEAEHKAFPADRQAFLQSTSRSKWSAQLD